jgi:cystathionine gamma-lyase
MKFRTRAIHVGHGYEKTTGAVVPPIHVASTFVQPGAGQWGAFDYSRSGNPTRSAVEEVCGNLEGGLPALGFASGMAATHAAMMLLQPGDHVVAGTDLYGGTYRLLHKILAPLKISTTHADLCDLQATRAAMQPNTKMVWAESIGNPRMSVPDLDALVSIAHEQGALLGVDNTLATPVLVRPLERGADIVMHSATKYFGGHSDVLAGLLMARTAELRKRLYFIQNATGAVMDPFTSFLLGRGIKTLDLRFRAQSENALTLARRLEQHPLVERVHYPGLPSHPSHAVAANLFGNCFGAMISFEPKATAAQAAELCNQTQLFHLAVSLGAVESLIAVPAKMSHATYDPAARAAAGIHDHLIRLSVGLEDVDDLWNDLDQAIQKAC